MEKLSMINTKTVVKIAVISLFLISTPSQATQKCVPTWCSSAKLTKVERMICQDAALSAADVLMEVLYKQVLKNHREGMWKWEIKSEQRNWTAKRNQLDTVNDILNVYIERIQELSHQ
jgi:uncharacterized protein